MFCLSPLYLQLLIKSKSYFICSWKGLRSQEVRSQASGSQLWGKAKVQVIQVMATAHCIAVAPQNFVNNWSFLCETNRVAFFLVLGQFSLQYGSVPHWGGKTWRGMIGGSVRGRYMIYSLAELFVHFHRQACPARCVAVVIFHLELSLRRSALLTPEGFEALRCLYFSLRIAALSSLM